MERNKTGLNINYSILFIGVMGFVSFLFVIYFLYQMSQQNLSNLATGIFAIMLSVTTTAIAIVVSIILSGRALEEQLKMYGKLAMRRIVQSLKSCRLLIDTICSKKLLLEKKKTFKKEIVMEFLDNLACQSSRLLSTISDSKEDWIDILSDEIKEADEIDKEYGQLRIKYHELQSELIFAKKELTKTKEKADAKEELEVKVNNLEDKLKNARNELSDLRRKSDSLGSVWPTGTALGAAAMGAYPSGDNALFGEAPWIHTVAGISKCVDCDNFTNLVCSECGRPLCNICESQTFFIGTPFKRLCSECKKKTDG